MSDSDDDSERDDGACDGIRRRLSSEGDRELEADECDAETDAEDEEEEGGGAERRLAMDAELVPLGAVVLVLGLVEAEF